MSKEPVGDGHDRPDSDNHDHHLQKGIQALDNNAIEEAKEHFAHALNLDDSSTASFYLGLIAAGEHAHEKAIEYFNQAIENDSQNELTYLHLAKSFIEIDENKLAISCLKSAYRINNENFDIVHYLALTYFLQSEYEKAIKYFDVASKLNPKSRDSYYYKGISLNRIDQHNEAITNLQHALDIDPNDHYTLYQLAHVYLKLQDLQHATTLFKKAKELGNPDAEEWLAQNA